MESVKRFAAEVSTWPHISVVKHRYGGQEFRLMNAQVGHVHEGGAVDIPFPRAIRDVLLAEGLASKHLWIPDSGWVTFRVQNEEDVEHALWLMRLSYVRYAARTAAEPTQFLQQELRCLRVTPTLISLLEEVVVRPPSPPFLQPAHK